MDYMPHDKPCRTCTDFKTWSKLQKKSLGSENKSKNNISTENKTEEKMQESKRKNCPLDKNELGSHTWAFLHTMAAYYPNSPTTEQKKDMNQFFNIFAKFYPCNICAEDLQVQLKSSPPQTENQHQLSQWLCKIHNEVNVKLGKPEFDCKLVDQRWRDGWLDGSCD